MPRISVGRMTEPSYLQDTRTSYDTVAVSYAELVTDGGPWEAACLDVFAGLVRDVGPVLDAGCGPGRVTGLLRARDLDASGMDLSPGMVQVARRDHPGVRFDIGSMTELDLPDGRLGGVIAWWSIVHLPRDVLPVALAEFHRVLAPGGTCLIGFHVGATSSHKTSGYGGHPVSLEVYRWRPEAVSELAARVGFVLHTQLVSNLDQAVPQACLFFQKQSSDPPATAVRRGGCGR